MKLFRSAKELVDFLSKKKSLPMVKKGNCWTYVMNKTITFTFDLDTNVFDVKDGKTSIIADRRTIFDLTNPENHSVVMLLLNILERGYALSTITLEKKWQTGHSPIWLDVMLKNPINKDIYMIEVKRFDEYQKYSNPYNESKVKQLCSYAMQEQTTTIASFYSYDFDNDEHCFSNIFCKELRNVSLNTDDFYDRWNKLFDSFDFISLNLPFDIQKNILKYDDLKTISQDDTKILFEQFLTILRVNSISDKPTAFIRMINLFLSKLEDEIYQDVSFSSTDVAGLTFYHEGLRFQYIDDEAPESFLKRLNELYKDGMSRCLKKNVIDYTDSELKPWIEGGDNAKLMEAFDNLRLKKNNCFAFIEVYDDTTFQENFFVVKEIVKLLQNFKFKYDAKHQFLGDFFEDLLNTSLKQEAGQFFTPYPLVDYMVNSLNIKEVVINNLKQRNLDFIPKFIDYACGAGHFLISTMSKVQDVINDLTKSSMYSTLTKDQQKKINTYISAPYDWANTMHVVGIEKDYRLAKTTKIATFLNGDGDAEIIAGDGIAKFNCKEYDKTILHCNSNKNELFDFVISNPPYSVDGFMQNFRRNGIDSSSGTFTLLNSSYNSKDSRIEIFFVERAEQLLKKGGMAALILPQSILSGEKYDSLRQFIFKNFKIVSLLLTADITFSGTTTSPVILFLRKEHVKNQDYDVLIHMSPKYKTPSAPKMKVQETKFLGYEFSNNRNNSGITVIKPSVLEQLSEVTNEFIKTGSVAKVDSNYSKIVKLSDIILNKTTGYSGDIYPKKTVGIKGKSLKAFCKINEWTENDFSVTPSQYLEIGDLGTQVPSKRKISTRYCKKGDILISSLLGKDKIVIAKNEFMLTTAVYVLSSFKSNKERDVVFKRLKSDDVLEQMSALLDGFKITYAKISEYNLYNNVLI